MIDSFNPPEDRCWKIRSENCMRTSPRLGDPHDREPTFACNKFRDLQKIDQA
jgi:hypothetical protein